MTDSLNWYLVGIKNDPGDQIAWLENELAEIEAAGGYAYIIGHIYPKDYIEVWGGRYHALMERYQHVIRMGMFGHTHSQYFEVTRSSSNPAKNIGMNQIGPSVTTYTENNPGYAIIEIDQETMLPTNFLIYALDIDKANASGVADWELVVDYVNDYNMTEMSPNGLYDLASRFKTDMDLLSLFNWGKSRKFGL